LLLALDIGNTQTSFGIFEESKLQHHWRAETKAPRTADEYAALLFPLLDHVGLKGVLWKGVAVASVVPPANHPFTQFARDYLRVEPFMINSGIDLGFRTNVDVPAEVGADRLANAAYAVKHLRLPAVVVDIGTTTNFDVVSEGGVYEGGAIIPGVRMGVESLGTRTAKLPIIDLQFPKSVVGKNTVECIRVGILLGYCVLIDGLLNRLHAELGKPYEVVLTGGLASMLQPHLKNKSCLLPNLTLDGVELLYARNQ